MKGPAILVLFGLLVLTGLFASVKADMKEVTHQISIAFSQGE